jgi:hypothetical protein
MSGFFPLMSGDSRVISLFLARIWTPPDKFVSAPRGLDRGLGKISKSSKRTIGEGIFQA